MSPVMRPRKTSTFHDFPYSRPGRKCFHCWIINVTPPGPGHCVHRCIYCYAREAVYTDYSGRGVVYNNLPELVGVDLRRLKLCPPISISNVSDPCQDVPELRGEVVRLVRLIMEEGISFAITTKGDAGFLLDIPGFAAYDRKGVAVTIEGTADMLNLVSPEAPPFEARLASVQRLSRAGVSTVVRLDPVFPHLFRALYGESWPDEASRLVRAFASAGARHVVSSTGRLARRMAGGPGSLQKMRDIIARVSRTLARDFDADYRFESTWAGNGYLLRRDLRPAFHGQMRRMVEGNGMTYATCQELPAENDTPGTPGCEGLALPFVRRDEYGRFRPVEGCTAACHVTCRGMKIPPCGRPWLAREGPLRLADLR